MDVYRPEDIARVQNLLGQTCSLVVGKVGVTVIVGSHRRGGEDAASQRSAQAVGEDWR